MANGVYVMTSQGRQAHAGKSFSVPPQLRPLLALIDGKRTRDEALDICGRSAVTSGGLRWLASSGFIQRVPRGPSESALAPDSVIDAPHTVPSADEADPSQRAPSVRIVRGDASAAMPTVRGGSSHQASLMPMQQALSAYMVDAIRRHLGEDGDDFLHRVKRATTLKELLVCLSPMIDIVLELAGPQAAAEFADGAAGILQPQ